MKNKTIIPLTIIDLHGDGFHPLLDIVVFGESSEAVLDTGASRTAFDRGLLIEANAQANIVASEQLSTGLGTTSMESATAVIEGLGIGDFVVPEIEVAVLDLSSINYAYEQMGHPQVLGVIGSDILMRYQGVIDYGRKQLTLKSYEMKSPA